MTTFALGTPYAQGDFVTYNGSLYRARIANPSGTPGTSADFELVSVQGPTGPTGTILIGKCVKSNKILKNYNKIYHITWSAALWRLWAAFSYITTEEGGM